MNGRFRIAIATAGRFHMLDLARELHALGHEVRLYSYVPRARARLFGLPDECHVSLLPFAVPALAWQKVAPQPAPVACERLLYSALNWGVMLRLKPCELFICMSGIYLEAAHFAKRQFNAEIWLERASRHILSQDEILAAVPGAERPSHLAIDRELAGYDTADRIVVPSSHVAESFGRDPGLVRKLFVNPYGVDLGMFPLQYQRGNGQFVLLFVGNWSLRKGCDLLEQAVKRLSGVTLWHVGTLGDHAFPKGDGRFIHHGHVLQTNLVEFYSRASAFVLASREEGLAYVQAQALASGLPIICSDRTGGPDLAHTSALADRITIVPHGDVGALAAAIESLRQRLTDGLPLPPLSPADRESLSWAAYARRYSDELVRQYSGGPHSAMTA